MQYLPYIRDYAEYFYMHISFTFTKKNHWDRHYLHLHDDETECSNSQNNSTRRQNPILKNGQRFEQILYQKDIGGK